MVRNFIDGYDVVYGVRNKRDTDTFFKRTTAVGFYKLMQFMGVNIVFNHADYRLMSKRALDGLAQFPERNLFLRGMVPLVGYRSTNVYYDRNERFAGESKYPLKKMLSFAFDGITSFSISPISAENYRSHRCRLGVTYGFDMVYRRCTAFVCRTYRRVYR